MAISEARFGPGQAAHAVLARDDVFADSLGGSALTPDGPLLYTSSRQLLSSVADELRRAVAPGGDVYLLGGTAALDEAVADAVRGLGLQPVRLAGPSRIHTALEVASAARELYGPGPIAVARADSWADSVTAGAWAAAEGATIVLSSHAALDQPVWDWLGEVRPSRMYTLGGPAALSDRVVGDATNASGTPAGRVAGTTRDTTATEIARRLRMDHTTAVVVHGFDDDGWVAGLAAAGLAADANGVILLTGDTLPDSTAERLGRLSCTDVRTVGLGGQVDPARPAIAAAAGCT